MPAGWRWRAGRANPVQASGKRCEQRAGHEPRLVRAHPASGNASQTASTIRPVIDHRKAQWLDSIVQEG